MASDFAQDVIDCIHEIWLQHQNEYSAGYSVFYGPVRFRPELMLIGFNPGGDESCFSGKKEVLVAPEEPMEYLTYRNDSAYPLAGRTVNIFESIGLIDLLRNSVKTNINFFRSKRWPELPQQHARECLQLVLSMIYKLEPRAILCESIGAYDILYPHIIKNDPHPRLNIIKNDRNRRIYISALQEDCTSVQILIGITHLTGSRPSAIDIKQIKQILNNDFHRTFQST